VFLTEAGTRHALLVKNKTFADDDRTESARDGTGQSKHPVVIQEDSDDDDLQMNDIPQARDEGDDEIVTYNEDKKKLSFNTTYDGFNIWGFVLCLLVERTGQLAKKASGDNNGGAQALMEEWISTQQAQDEDDF
jgi:hypothetical protein